MSDEQVKRDVQDRVEDMTRQHLIQVLKDLVDDADHETALRIARACGLRVPRAGTMPPSNVRAPAAINSAQAFMGPLGVARPSTSDGQPVEGKFVRCKHCGVSYDPTRVELLSWKPYHPGRKVEHPAAGQIAMAMRTGPREMACGWRPAQLVLPAYTMWSCCRQNVHTEAQDDGCLKRSHEPEV
ncbi:hypothetical protein PG984_007777 [Apiospora sp. TS-2023a]